MANTKSAQKNVRKTSKLTDHNRQVRSRLKTLARKARTDEGAEAAKSVAEYIAALDKAAKRGIVHENKARRHKSILAPKLAKS